MPEISVAHFKIPLVLFNPNHLILNMLKQFSSWKARVLLVFISHLMMSCAIADSIDKPKKEPHWTLSIETIALKRSNDSVSQALVSSLPGNSTTFEQTPLSGGTEIFNSNQFDQSLAVGPKINLNYLDNSGVGLDISYFNVMNLNATKTIGPEQSPNWYVMKAPGTFPAFWQTQDFPYQGMTWGSTTSLHSAETNIKSTASKDFHILAGARWLQLNDSLVGSLTPGDHYEPNWKSSGSCGATPFLTEINNICNGLLAANSYPPFWTTRTSNNLFGLQAGAEGTLFKHRRFSLEGMLKAGAYINHAKQSDWVSMAKVMYSSSATVNRAAFVGDVTIKLKYLITQGLAIKLGYEFLWLDNISLAPGQISQTYSGQNPTSMIATGVNTGSNILFQGGTLGLEYTF